MNRPSRHSPPHYSLPPGRLPFLVSERGRYDYRHLYAFSRWFEKTLPHHLTGGQQPLLTLSASSDRLVFVLAACWLLEIPFLPADPSMSDAELRSLLSRMQPAAAFTDAENSSRLSALSQSLPQIALSEEQLAGSGENDEPIYGSGKPGLLLGMLLTSGSTGRPRIVPLKREQILFAAAGSEQHFRPDPAFSWLLCLPLHHAGGLAVLLRSLLYHSAVHRINRFHPSLVEHLLLRNRQLQTASMVPTMLKRLLERPEFGVHPGFRALLLGGGPIHPRLLQQAVARSIPVVASYGMTESCGQIAANPLFNSEGGEVRLKNVGRVFPPNAVQIRDANNRPLPAGRSGSVWLQGPQLFDGYLTKEGIDRSAFDPKGWFHTGDIGSLDSEQRLAIHARRTDLILSGGENILPVEVEAALQQLDQIDEAAVIGVEDAEWGQMVVAFLTPSQGARPAVEEIREQLRGRLSPHKIPKRIIWLEKLPRTGPGKVHKGRLGELYESRYR